MTFAPKDEDQKQQFGSRAKAEAVSPSTVSIVKSEPEPLSVASVFPGKTDFPPEFHPIDWFIDLDHTDEVEKLFEVLTTMVDKADLGPIRMREGVDAATTPSAMEHLRRLDRDIEKISEDYSGSIVRMWLGEKGAAWYSMSEQLRRTVWNLRERLKWVKKVLFDCEYSRFRLRWYVEYTRMVTSEYVQRGKNIEDKTILLEIQKEIRERMIRERGDFAAQKYDLLRRELWGLSGEISAVLKQSEELGQEESGLGSLSKREHDIEREKLDRLHRQTNVQVETR